MRIYFNDTFIETRRTRGKRRVGKNNDGTSRFRGPGIGKGNYVATDGKNPTRTMNGGRV